MESVTVDMLKPKLENPEQFIGPSVLEADGRKFEGTYVCMGNPHFVTFVDDIDTIDIAHYGKSWKETRHFPSDATSEFAQVTDTDIIRTRVWERGSGITMACGTGACATAVAAALTKRTGRKSSIVMDGGTLEIEYSEADDHVYMTGPAAFVIRRRNPIGDEMLNEEC